LSVVFSRRFKAEHTPRRARMRSRVRSIRIPRKVVHRRDRTVKDEVMKRNTPSEKNEWRTKRRRGMGKELSESSVKSAKRMQEGRKEG